MMRRKRRGRGMGTTDDAGNPILLDGPSAEDIQAANDYNSWLDSSGPLTPGSAPIDWSKLISSATNGALSIFKATSSPYVIPGTNSVYDPASGRVLGQTLPGQVSNPFSNVAGGVGGSGSLLLIGGLLVAGVVAVKMFGK